MEIDGVGSTESQPLEFAQHCATSKELRDASVAAEKKLSEFHVEMSMRKDIFDNVKAFKVRQLGKKYCQIGRHVSFRSAALPRA